MIEKIIRFFKIRAFRKNIQKMNYGQTFNYFSNFGSNKLERILKSMGNMATGMSKRAMIHGILHRIGIDKERTE